MWVRIVRARTFFPPGRNHRVAVFYPKDLVCSVKRAWGEALIEAGDAVEVPTPRRPSRS